MAAKPSQLQSYIAYWQEGTSAGNRGTPQAEEECAVLRAHLVVGHDVGVLPAHVADVLQQRVALLPLAHQDGVWVDLRTAPKLPSG